MTEFQRQVQQEALSLCERLGLTPTDDPSSIVAQLRGKALAGDADCAGYLIGLLTDDALAARLTESLTPGEADDIQKHLDGEKERRLDRQQDLQARIQADRVREEKRPDLKPSRVPKRDD